MPEPEQTAEEMKKSIKKKQEYGGLEKKEEIKVNPLDVNPTLAIEGNKALAITGSALQLSKKTNAKKLRWW